MNETIKTIFARQSVRKFSDRLVPRDSMAQIVAAGLQAPSGTNTQAWHVTVVQNPDVIARIEQAMREAIIAVNYERYVPLAKNPNYDISYGAPTFVLVSADAHVSKTPLQDASALIVTMFIAAESLGVSSCWINQPTAVSDEPNFRALLTELGIPKEQTVYACGAFGYPAGNVPPKPERKTDVVNYVA